MHILEALGDVVVRHKAADSSFANKALVSCGSMSFVQACFRAKARTAKPN